MKVLFFVKSFFEQPILSVDILSTYTGCKITFTAPTYNLKLKLRHKVFYTKLKPSKTASRGVIKPIIAYGRIEMFCIIRQNTFVLQDFDHRNMVVVQNKSSVRNQHQKLHLMTNFFYRKKVDFKSRLYPPRLLFLPDFSL